MQAGNILSNNVSAAQFPDMCGFNGSANTVKYAKEIFILPTIDENSVNMNFIDYFL